MSAALISTAARSLGALGVYAFIIEILLPGGARAALLLWLLRGYLKDGFANVRQYLHAPRIAKPAIFANAQPGIRKICRCLQQTVYVGAWPGGFRQRCERSARALPVG
jgi:hypothetical protein